MRDVPSSHPGQVSSRNPLGISMRARSPRSDLGSVPSFEHEDRSAIDIELHRAFGRDAGIASAPDAARDAMADHNRLGMVAHGTRRPAGRGGPEFFCSVSPETKDAKSGRDGEHRRSGLG